MALDSPCVVVDISARSGGKESEQTRISSRQRVLYFWCCFSAILPSLKCSDGWGNALGTIAGNCICWINHTSLETDLDDATAGVRLPLINYRSSGLLAKVQPDFERQNKLHFQSTMRKKHKSKANTQQNDTDSYKSTRQQTSLAVSTSKLIPLSFGNFGKTVWECRAGEAT